MTLRIGILGTGYAAEIHSKALRVVAPEIGRWYASRDKTRAAAAASRFGGKGTFGSYEDAIASRELDAVVIALPPSLHRDWTLRALAAGKHVIVEKPPFLTVAELDEAASAARRADRQILVAENYFYKPLTATLRTVITGNELGPIILVQLNALKRQVSAGWRDDPAMAGGGALFEGGIHWISLLSNIGLTPARIRASFPHGGAGRPGRAGGPDGSRGPGVVQGLSPASNVAQGFSPVASERSAIVTIDYAEGSVATLSYSWDLPSLVNGVRMSRVYGADGVLRFETNGLFGVLAGRRRRLLVPGVFDLAGYRAMMKDFVSSIQANRSPAYTLALARRDLDLVARAYASVTGASSVDQYS